MRYQYCYIPRLALEHYFEKVARPSFGETDGMRADAPEGEPTQDGDMYGGLRLRNENGLGVPSPLEETLAQKREHVSVFDFLKQNHIRTRAPSGGVGFEHSVRRPLHARKGHAIAPAVLRIEISIFGAVVYGVEEILNVVGDDGEALRGISDAASSEAQEE
jgi:hypothetical protein